MQSITARRGGNTQTDTGVGSGSRLKKGSPPLDNAGTHCPRPVPFTRKWRSFWQAPDGPGLAVFYVGPLRPRTWSHFTRAGQSLRRDKRPGERGRTHFPS